VEPEIPEKNISDTIDTIPRPFRKCPTKARARLTRRMEIPPVSIRAPARMKNGIAKRGKESEPVKIFWGTMIRGMSPLSRRPKIEANPMLKAMGTLTATRDMKAMLRKSPIGIKF
jgi:hypothetical protein